MITLGFSLGGIAGALHLNDSQEHALASGGLDRSHVVYVYHTQEDANVRPSHAALNGTTWELGDPFAPVPPCGYGCRCYMTYEAKEETPAVKILPETTVKPVPLSDVYAKHLDKEVPDWRELAKASKDKPRALRLIALTEVLKAQGNNSAQVLQDLANMILEASIILDRKD